MKEKRTVTAAVAVILVCVVAPMLLGYVYPSESGDQIRYEQVGDLNLTGSLSNTEVPSAVSYTGRYNNMYLFDSNRGDPLAQGTSTTTTIGNWPALERSSGDQLSFTDGQSLNLGSISEDNPDSYLAIIRGSSSSSVTFEVTEADGSSEEYNRILYYLNSGLTFAYSQDTNEQTTKALSNVTGKSITIHSNGTENTCSVMLYDIMTDSHGNNLYVDSNEGFTLAHQGVADYSTWMNTYTNRSVSLLIHMEHDEEGSVGAQGINIYFGDVSNTLDIRYVGDNLSTFMTGMGDSQTIGSADVYDYLLITADADAGAVTVTGLVGMTGFRDDYTSKLGNSCTFNVGDRLDPFSMIGMRSSSNVTLTYYVVEASIEGAFVDAMQDVEIDPDSYYPDGEYALTIRSVGQYGDSITFDTTAGTQTYEVSDGTISIPGLGDVPIVGMVIMHVPDVDGTYYTSINNVRMDWQLNSLTLDGLWIAAPYLTDVDSEIYDEYSWVPGGFGLDKTGFCMAGIIAAFCMFILGGLYARATGESPWIVFIVSAICGVIYFILLGT